MPAHKRPIREWQCNDHNCLRPAKFEVYDTFNRLMGRYCGVHANQRIERLNSGQKAKPF
jgi:hypothetical protein